MRVFIAVLLPYPPALAELTGSKIEPFHLTLRFLGEIPMVQLPSVVRAVEAGGVGCDPFELELRGVGAFPSPRAPRVVWVGVGRGRPQIVALAQRVSELLTIEGFPRDDRPFEPHATLARVRGPSDRARADRWLARGADLSFGEIRVEQILAFESVLSAVGAVHRPFAVGRLHPSTG